MNVNVEHAQLSMNMFDAAVLGVFGLSAIVAFFRGFVREILSLGAWVGAALITIYLFPQSTEFVKNHVKNPNVAAGTAALGTYMCALLALSLINSIIIRYLKTGAEVGMLDNLLGLMFGTVRGAFIVSLAFVIMSSVVPTGNKPDDKLNDKTPVWLKTSVTKPYLQEGADILAKIAPKYLKEMENIVNKQKEAQEKRLRDKEENSAEDAAQDELNADGTPKNSARKVLENMMGSYDKPAKDDESRKNDRQ